jgi:hypothetical protein
MAFKKFRKYRKTFRKIRRPFKKYRGIRVKRGRNIHYFKRTFLQEVNITNAGFVGGGTLGSSIETQLNNLPNHEDFTDLYDSYKICGVKKRFMFNRNTSDAGPTAAGYEIPQLITVNDYNDKTDLSNQNKALEYASFKTSRLDRPITRYYKPAIAIDILNDASSTAGMITKGRWISTAVVDVEHYGLKWAVDTINDATGQNVGTLRVYTTVYLACKTPR